MPATEDALWPLMMLLPRFVVPLFTFSVLTTFIGPLMLLVPAAPGSTLRAPALTKRWALMEPLLRVRLPAPVLVRLPPPAIAPLKNVLPPLFTSKLAATTSLLPMLCDALAEL